MAGSKVFLFGPFVLDAKRRTLTRDGEPVDLAPKPFSLLLLLVRHAGQTLSKDRLLKELWTDTIGTEANLSVNIATIRRALGEKPRDHRYIVTTPQRGYSFVAPYRTTTGPVSAAARPKERPRPQTDPATGGPRLLAVLPFRVVPPPSTDSGLGTGIADAVSTQTSSLRSWAVQSSRTVLSQVDADPLTMGRRLEVDAVLEGEIRTSTTRITVEVHLLDTGNGEMIWGDTVTEKPETISRLPRKIASSLMTALEPAHTEAQTPNASLAPGLAAFQEYVSGRFLLNRADPESVSASLEHFRRARKLEPAFALAYAGMAEGTYDLWRLGLLPSREAVPAIEDAARRAMELDPGLSEPYFWIAYLNMAHHWNWPVAETLFDLGLRRAPNSCLGRTLHAYFLLLAGEEEAAVEEARRAQALEPLNLLANTTVANIMRLTGNIDGAIRQFEVLLDLAPEYSWGRFMYGWTLIHGDRHRKALALFRSILDIQEDLPYALACMSFAHARLGEKSEAHRYHDRLMDLAETRPTEPYVVAYSHLAIGDRERAVAWLQKAYRERNPVLAYLRLEPCWMPLRDDPRVLDLISRIGAPLSLAVH